MRKYLFGKWSLRLALGLLAVLVLVLDVLPGMATQAYADTTYPIWVGDTQVTGENAMDTTGTRGWNYTPAIEGDDSSPAKLTLDGYNSESWYELDDEGVAIYAKQDLVIELHGTNTLVNEVDTVSESRYGIMVQGGDLTILGDGTLSVVDEDCPFKEGIHVTDGNLTIGGGIVNASGSFNGIAACIQDDTKKGSVAIDGAVVEARTTGEGGERAGIYSHSTVTIDGDASVTAAGWFYGIYANASVSIGGGEVEAVGCDECKDSHGIAAMGGYHERGFVITGGKVLATGTAYGIFGESTTMEFPDVAISAGEVEARATGKDGYGIYAHFSDVAIDGGEMTASGDRMAVSGTVRNSIAGTGWTDVEGTQGKAGIPENTEGQDLGAYKRTQFPAVAVVATPTFTPEGGFYTSAQNVEIDCETEGATIYYTTDGNDPTRESDEYTGAITVSVSTTVKAIAVKEDMDDSEVATAEYTISAPSRVPARVPARTVTLTGGANATTSGGATTQSGLKGAMTAVTYTAKSGYRFEAFDAISKDGVTAKRESDTTVVVAGTPTANVEIVIPDAVADDQPEPQPQPDPEPQPQPGALELTGSGHVQGVGDEAGTEDGGALLIGTTGESKRLESFAISLPEGTDGGIEYRAHVQGIGWTGWTQGGQECGTTGESRRIESVQVTLEGAVAEDNSVWYRVHSQTYGWLGWARDGQAAGTAGQSKRAEAVEVQVLPKGQVPEGYVDGQASYIGAATADVHLQGTGWTGGASALEFGTTGESRRLEAISITVDNQPTTGGVQYEAHVQGTGWTSPEADGAVAGTVGESRRLEAVRVSLTGEMGAGYSVWYRVHSQTYGWLGWAHDGADAGTTGMSKRAEAVEVQVLPQGQFPAGYDAAQAACLTE